MKIWTLVWFLVFPPSDDGLSLWEASKESNLTQEQCFSSLAENNVRFEHLQASGDIVGFEIYCKEEQ